VDSDSTRLGLAPMHRRIVTFRSHRSHSAPSKARLNPVSVYAHTGKQGENHNHGQIIGNPHAPIINALANDYSLATDYRGVGDPSEPNYVAMLGGNTFGVNSDDPYFFPANTVTARNLMSELDQAGLTWKGYFQGMPYPGYRGYCFPAKCNGIPDSDTQYVAKHNGIVNFADMQTAAEFAKLTPYAQLASDLASDQVPSFSYIVPDPESP
jgi:phospholipase C